MIEKKSFEDNSGEHPRPAREIFDALRAQIRGVLESKLGSSDTEAVRQEVGKILMERGVPHGDVLVMPDTQRQDGLKALMVHIVVSNSWPEDQGEQGQRTIVFRAPEHN